MARDALPGNGERVISTVTTSWSALTATESQISSPAWLATWLRIAPVTCWHLAAMDSLDSSGLAAMLLNLS
jgi:hypothetical protein